MGEVLWTSHHPQLAQLAMKWQYDNMRVPSHRQHLRTLLSPNETTLGDVGWAVQFIVLPIPMQLQYLRQYGQLTAITVMHEYAEFFRAQHLPADTSDTSTAAKSATPTAVADADVTSKADPFNKRHWRGRNWRNKKRRQRMKHSTERSQQTCDHSSATSSGIRRLILTKFHARPNHLTAKVIERSTSSDVIVTVVNADCLWASAMHSIAILNPQTPHALAKLNDVRFVVVTSTQPQESKRDLPRRRWSLTALHEARQLTTDVLTLELRGQYANVVYQHRRFVWLSKYFRLSNILMAHASRSCSPSSYKHVQKKTHTRRHDWKRICGKTPQHAKNGAQCTRAAASAPSHAGSSLQRAGLGGNFTHCTININFQPQDPFRKSLPHQYVKMFLNSTTHDYGPVSVVSSIGTHQVFITDAQFSEFQVFFRQQCSIDSANADFYSASMGERGHSLLHLMHQITEDRVAHGWSPALGFIQTYHRSAVEAGLVAVAEGRAHHMLYVDSEMEAIPAGIRIEEHGRPRSPASVVFESPLSPSHRNMMSHTRGEHDPVVSLSATFATMASTASTVAPSPQSPSVTARNVMPPISPNPAAVRLLVHLDGPQPAHYVWTTPDGRMFIRCGTDPFHDL